MPKLPKGMYRRRSCFYVRIYRGGREIRRSLGSDYEEACRRLRELRRGAATSAPDRGSVELASRDWLETVVRIGRNEKGYREAASRIARFLRPFLGHRSLASVTANDLRGYRLWLEEHGLAPASVAYMLGDARGFFRWCEESRLIERSPVPRRLLPRIPERPPDRLTDEEVEALSDTPDPYGFVVRFALATGLRWSELVRAQRSDIRGGTLLVGQTKSGRIRRVPLGRLILGELSGRIGRLVPFSSVGSFTSQMRRLSGVGRFHMHQTRHTFACRYLERGGSLHVLQQILGHSSVLVTQRYARLTDGAVLEEHRRLEEGRLGGQTGTETGTVAPGQAFLIGRNLRSGKGELA